MLCVFLQPKIGFLLKTVLNENQVHARILHVSKYHLCIEYTCHNTKEYMYAKVYKQFTRMYAHTIGAGMLCTRTHG